MRTKYLPIELLLALQIFLRTFFPHILTWKLFLLISIALYTLKALYEGFRLHWFLFPLASVLCIPDQPFLHYLATIIIVFSILYFPLFDHIDLTGDYKVGYKEIWLHNNTLHVSVYYPTTDKGPDSLQFVGAVPPWKNFHEMMKLAVGPGGSDWYIRIALSYLNHRKLGVNTNVPIIKSTNPFPVIVFSHGIGADKNTYSFYLKEWASRGYIVLSVDHKDIVYPPSGKTEDFEHRNTDLKKRLGDLRVLLDFILSPTGLKKLFIGDIEIDQSRISAIGHSYGGCSVAYLSLQDERVTGACVCMDPWYFPIEEELYKSMKKPLLIIVTEGFDAWAPGNRARVLRLASLNKEYSDQTMVCSFEGGTHNNLTDSGLYMAREMGFMKALSPIGLIERLFRNNASLIEAFLETTVLEKKQGKAVTKENVVEKFKEKKYHPEIQLVHEKLVVS